MQSAGIQPQTVYGNIPVPYGTAELAIRNAERTAVPGNRHPFCVYDTAELVPAKLRIEAHGNILCFNAGTGTGHADRKSRIFEHNLLDGNREHGFYGTHIYFRCFAVHFPRKFIVYQDSYFCIMDRNHLQLRLFFQNTRRFEHNGQSPDIGIIGGIPLENER